MLFSTLILCILVRSSFQNISTEAQQQLYHYGLLNTTKPKPEILKEAVKIFQTMNELPATGVLDNDTMYQMNAPRCGKIANASDFLDARDEWQKIQLTYKIYNWPEPFTKSQIQNVFKQAISKWTENVNLRITEVASDDTDIAIHFTQQDGPLNYLGYAYFPENGGIFLDKEEDWTFDSSSPHDKISFAWIAAHELGHSLGLPHSDSRQSIMYPYYSNEVIDPSESDVDQLILKYGSTKVNNSILCRGTSIDAILDFEFPLLIKGRHYWILSPNGVLRSGPFLLDEKFPGLPNKIDAAFVIAKTSYFFSNDKFYKFEPNSTKPRTKFVSGGFGIPSNIDAAFYDRVGHIYFFKGSKYYALDIRGQHEAVRRKDISTDWHGIPKNVEAATLIRTSQVLFIANSMCYILDLRTRELLSTQNCSSTLYNC